MESNENDTQMPNDERPPFNWADADDLRTFVGFFVLAGLVNAIIAALIVCRLPERHWHSVYSLMARATVYVLVGGCAGVVGAWLYWRRYSGPCRLRSPTSFGMFSLICAAGWVWVPAAVLLATQDSKATMLIGILCGATLGAGLRKGIGARPQPQRSTKVSEPVQMFAANLEKFPRESYGYAIAGCVYGAAYAQYLSEHLIAGLLAAAGAFLFAWNWKLPVAANKERIRRDASWRLVRDGGLAILITAWALMLGLAHRNQSENAAFAAASDGSGERKAHSGKAGESSVGPGGFESVILWPLPPKKQIIPPLPAPTNFQGPEKSRPVIIRFDGAYWYFQPPDTSPGRTAHKAHGNPLAVNIQANNSFPLVMEAHQRLIGPVRISRCGEIDVEIENRDNLRGALLLGVLLGDSTMPNKPTLYLGRKEIESSMPGFFSYKAAPLFETLRFAIPAAASIRKFDEITVMLLPDIEHAMIGPKIAISQFELLPR
jgi:hypothetical protein